MAKSSRSSSIKANRTQLKRRVFGPAELARTQRLNAKLMDLASQPKPAKTEMQIDQDADTEKTGTESKETGHATDDTAAAATTTMDLDNQPKGGSSARKAEKKRKEAKSDRIEKKRHRKVVNRLTFAKKPGKARGKK